MAPTRATVYDARLSLVDMVCDMYLLYAALLLVRKPVRFRANWWRYMLDTRSHRLRSGCE